MKRIILDCDLMKFPNSGLYHYCLNLGKYIQLLLEQDASAKIAFYVPPAEASAFGPTARHITEKKSFWNFLRSPVQNCDVWHAPFQSGRIVPDKKKNPWTKIVLTIHDLNMLHEGKSADEQRRGLAHTQSLIDKADVIVCISEFTKRDVVSHCDTYGKPVHVIYNGTNKLEMPQLLPLSYQPRLPFLFGMGYVNRKKNYEALLPLLKKNENIELIIAGYQDDTDYVEGMLHKAKKWGMADRVTLSGPVSESEKAWYLQHCMAFVHPSIAEGFGFPVIEAMTFGKPVFMSDRTALPEIGGDAAFYFSSFDDDYMQRVFSEGMQRYNSNGMSEEIKKRSETFKWEKSAVEYLHVYKSLY